jgi:hypothetical protein
MENDINNDLSLLSLCSLIMLPSNENKHFDFTHMKKEVGDCKQFWQMETHY